MNHDWAFAQLHAVQGRVASFGEQVAADVRPAVEVLPEALLELGSALEELRVCEEELHAQADELTSSRASVEAITCATGSCSRRRRSLGSSPAPAG